MLFAEFSFKELPSWNEKSMLCTLTIKMPKITFQNIPCGKSKHYSLLVQVEKLHHFSQICILLDKSCVHVTFSE